jgi:hypothetical protein
MGCANLSMPPFGGFDKLPPRDTQRLPCYCPSVCSRPTWSSLCNTLMVHQILLGSVRSLKRRFGPILQTGRPYEKPKHFDLLCCACCGEKPPRKLRSNDVLNAGRSDTVAKSARPTNGKPATRLIARPSTSFGWLMKSNAYR